MADSTIQLTAVADRLEGVSKALASFEAMNPANFLNPPVRLLNILFDCLTRSRFINDVINGLHESRGGWVVTLNLDHLRRCWTDPAYEACVKQADLRVADGMPLIWASRLQKTPLPERVAGSDLIFHLSEALSEHRRSIFLLGGDPGTAETAGKVLETKFPGLVIAGTYCPPLGFEHQPQEWCRITSLLVDTQPDVVMVGLGSPKQEYCIRKLRHLLPNAWWMGVGISFSFVCGRIKRAPRWMQQMGLEWLHRLTQEPKRLMGRYLAHGVPFGLFLLWGSIIRRWRVSADGFQPNSLQSNIHVPHSQRGHKTQSMESMRTSGSVGPDIESGHECLLRNLARGHVNDDIRR